MDDDVKQNQKVIIQARVGSEQKKQEIKDYALSQGYSDVSEFLRVVIEERMSQPDIAKDIRLRKCLQRKEIVDLIKKCLEKYEK